MIKVTSRKFRRSLLNGSDFGDYTAIESDTLKANTMERVRAVISYEASFTALLTAAETFDFRIGEECTRSLGSFVDDGFAIGDHFKYFDHTGAEIFNGTVNYVSDDLMQYGIDGGIQPSLEITDLGCKFRFNGTIDGVKYRYGIVGNSASISYDSPVVGKEQVYFCGLGGGGSLQTALPTDYNHETGSLQCKIQAGPDEFTYLLKMEHIFIFHPFYLPEFLPYILSGNTPPLFQGANAMRYISEIELRKTVGDANSNKVHADSVMAGAGKWIGQNVNYQAPKYSLASLTIQTTSEAPLPRVNASIVTQIIAVITCTDPIISADTRLNIGFSLAKVPVFKNESQTLNERLSFSLAAGSLSGVGDNGVIRNVIIGGYTTTGFSVQFDIEGIDIEVVDKGDQYMLTFGVADEDVSTDLTEALTGLMDFDTLDGEGIDEVPGLVTMGDMKLYDYNKDFATNSGTPGTLDALAVWNQDELGLGYKFALNLNGNTADPELVYVRFAVVAKRIGNILYPDNTFEMPNSSYTIPIGVMFVMEGGMYKVSYVTVNDERNYNMPHGVDLRKVTLDTSYNLLLAPNVVNYEGFIAFKVDWQTWLQNLFADTIFRFDNLNNKTSNFSDLFGYKIHARVLVGVQTFDAASGAFTLSEYPMDAFPMTVFDWDKDGNDPPNWTQVGGIFTEDGVTDLNNRLLFNQRVMMRVTWTRISDTAFDEADINAIHRIEPYNAPNSGFIEIMGTKGGNLEHIFQKVNTGIVGLRVRKVGSNKVITETLIDGTKLPPGRYKLSGRLWAD